MSLIEPFLWLFLAHLIGDFVLQTEQMALKKGQILFWLTRSGSQAYKQLEQRGRALEKGFRHAAKKRGVPVQFQRIGSMFCAYFINKPVVNLADAKQSDIPRFIRFFKGMLERGVYLAPSQFEAGFISTAHSEKEIEVTIRAADESLKD